MSLKKVDARIRALMEFHGADGEAADLIGRLCFDLLKEAGEDVPVDLEMLASFRNAHVAHADQEQPEMIHWDGRSFHIRLRAADTLGRRRFSCAHAIVHTWFFESAGHGQDKADAEQGWSESEEDLCDLGAAALLLPESTFRSECPPDVNMDDVLRMANVFQASAECTALRAVVLSSTPLAMVVLEKTLKPTERSIVTRQQSRRSPRIEAPTILPRLRVVKSFGQGMGFVPRYKSVGDSPPLAKVLDNGGVDYVGEVGILDGTYRISARNMPIRRTDQLVDRVVALIAPAPSRRVPPSVDRH